MKRYAWSSAVAGFCVWILLASSAYAISDVAVRKASAKCQQAIARGGAKLSSVELAVLGGCVNAISTCIQIESRDPVCIGKAQKRCTTVASKTLPAAKTKYEATVGKACGEPLRPEDLLASDGLGLASRAGGCNADFGLDFCANPAALAQCLAEDHARAAAEAVSLAQPRAAELVQEVLPTAISIDGLTRYPDCDGCAVSPPGTLGKTIARCGTAIAKASRSFVAATRKSLDGCVAGIFACVQTKASDPVCLTKARTKCNATAVKLTGVREKLRTALRDRCGDGVAAFATLSSRPGLNLGALAAECSSAGIDTLAGIDDFAACVQRRHECATAALIRRSLPISENFATDTFAGGVAGLLAGTGCPAPSPAPASLARGARVGIGTFFGLTKRLAGNGSVAASRIAGSAPPPSSEARRALSIGQSQPRFAPGALQKLTLRYSGTSARGAKVATEGDAPTETPMLIATIRRDDLVVEDHFEVPLDALAPDSFGDVDLEIQYGIRVPSCAFEIAFAVQEGTAVSAYVTLPQVLDLVPTAVPTPSMTPKLPTPPPTATATSTVARSATRTPTPKPTANCTTTQAIVCGETKGGVIAAIGDGHCYTFSAATGEAFAITTAEVTGPLQACWQVFGASGPTERFCGQQPLLVTSSGAFTLRVFDDIEDETGSYNVSLDALSGTFTGVSNGTENPVCRRGSDGTQPIHCGETKSGGAIDVVGDTDTYTFSAAANEAVFIGIAATSGTLDTCFELFAPDGAPVRTDCDFAAQVLPAQSGVYTIKVYDRDHDETGPYNLTLDVISGTADGVPTTTACQTGGDGTQTIACGETKTGTIGLPSDSDTYVFHAAGGETVSIASAASTPGLRTCWTLRAPDGGVVGAEIACGQDERTLPLQAGSYTIAVFDDGGRETGDYSLTLDALSATFDGASNGPPTPVCQTGGDGTKVIACDETQEGAFDVIGDTDTYAFSGTGGSVVTIATTESTNLSACWQLFAPDGTMVGAATCGSAQQTLPPASGTYTIVVSESSEDAAGAYTITLSGECS